MTKNDDTMHVRKAWNYNPTPRVRWIAGEEQ